MNCLLPQKHMYLYSQTHTPPYVEEDEDGPHFESIVPLLDKVDVKSGEEDEEEMFCKRAKLFRLDSDTKEWKERGIGSIKILKHKTSGKVRLLMRREQVLKICANHYITTDMALKPNAGSDRSWVWYAMDWAGEIPKAEQLAIRFKTADDAALFKVKFEEAQKFLSESPQGQPIKNKCETPEPQVSFKEVDLKNLFSKKEGEWDCDVCCVRNAFTSVVCVACNSSASSTAKVKPLEELKGFAPVAPPAKWFSFGLSGDYAKNTASADVSLKGFTIGCQLPVSFRFGSKDAAVTSAGFGAQANNKTIQTVAPQHKTAVPAVPFGTGFDSEFAKKERQWDCDSCLLRNDASATKCVSCKAPCSFEKSNAASQDWIGALFHKNDGQWDCDICLVRNRATSIHCVSCQTANPNMKNKTSDAPSSPSFTFSFGSSSSQPAGTGFKASFSQSTALQFSTSKAEKSSSSFSFSKPASVSGFKFDIAGSEAKPSDRHSQNGSESDLHPTSSKIQLRKYSLHKEQEKEAAPCSSDKSVDNDSHSNNPLFTGKPNTFSFADLAQSSFQFGQKDPTFKGFAGAGEQLFTGFHSGPRTDISDDEDGEMYKTEENDDIQFEPIVQMPEKVDLVTGEEDEKVYANSSVHITPSQPDPVTKKIFCFGESSTGISFSFQPILSPSKSPSKLNQSLNSVDTDDEQEASQEVERNGQYFEPLVPLPDLVDVSTGEENERVLFSHRAKLYRYDKDLSLWKERGIGNLKILQHHETKRVRLVMRRDQVLKLCANHWIASNMKLEPMKGAEKAWIWSPFDFAEGQGKVEQLAVRFKLQETANAFKEVFEEAKTAQGKDTLLAPFSAFSKPDRTSGAVQKIFGSPSPSKEKSPVIIPSSKDEETGASRLKISEPAVASQSSVGTPFSIPTRSKLCSVTDSLQIKPSVQPCSKRTFLQF